MNHHPILLGSAFPLALVRRRVVIEPRPLAELRNLLQSRTLASFWGHRNTLGIAQLMLGVDVRPKTERPALFLNEAGLPMLDAIIFSECWIVSPDYVPGYRPAIGEEIPAHKIIGWQVLRMEWASETNRI